jgi:hypothetical protein
MAANVPGIVNRVAIISPSITFHPIFTSSPVAIAPVASTPSVAAMPGTALLVGNQPISTSTGQNAKIGSVPTTAFANGTAPVLYSTSLGYASVGIPGVGAGAAISAASTVSTSPSFEAEGNLATPAGAPNTSTGPATAASIESAVAGDIPGGSLLTQLPTWFWLILAALVAYLWYTGESPRDVVKQVTA